MQTLLSPTSSIPRRRLLRCYTLKFKDSFFRSRASIRRQHISQQLGSTEPNSHTPSSRVIFSGIQPTGVPHLGNYLGALRPWVKLQSSRHPTDQLNFSIVDLHALTAPQDPAQLSQWRRDTYIALLAVGLDPQKCRIFYQSEVMIRQEQERQA